MARVTRYEQLFLPFFNFVMSSFFKFMATNTRSIFHCPLGLDSAILGTNIPDKI
ncbi:hypothetical protein [Lysinibacillus sphaericus]|uniref:hypothetical protein n=1 Tax=Lysinibacillus sphaericus TaxID=1421 RepID=UPI003D0360FD